VKVWLEETYNLRGVTPRMLDGICQICWRRPII